MHEELGQLLHSLEADGAGKPEQPLPSLADEEAPVLGGHELRQRARAGPELVQVLALGLLVWHGAEPPGDLHQGEPAEVEGGAQVLGTALPEEQVLARNRGAQVRCPMVSACSSGALENPASGSSTSRGGWPRLPSSADARPKKRPTVQSAISRRRRATPGISARW